MQGQPPGQPLGVSIAGHLVRPATDADPHAANEVCRGVNGNERAHELRDAIRKGSASVVEHAQRIVGYASDIGFFGHAVGETSQALMALVAAAKAFSGPGVIVPCATANSFAGASSTGCGWYSR